MYARLYSWPNLLLAYQKAAKGKRGHANVATFEHRLEDNLLQLQTELETQTYAPGPYTSFYIHEPKRRLISAAPFRDRVAHHALCNLIEPIFEQTFSPSSFANRVGKGTHRALAQAQTLARQSRYVLPCDVAQFFPSIDHAHLRGLLARKIQDEQVRWLCDQILASGIGVLAEEYRMTYFSGDDLFAALRPRGLPIGNLTSQFWANVYLTPFDHFLMQEVRVPFVRYVDDVLIFGNDLDHLAEMQTAVEARLARFRLTIHPGTHPRPVTEGFPFLGFQLTPEKRRLKRRKGIYFQRKYRRLLHAYAEGKTPLREVTASVQGWVNHVRYGNTVGLRKAVLGRVHVGRIVNPSYHP